MDERALDKELLENNFTDSPEDRAANDDDLNFMEHQSMTPFSSIKKK